MLRSCGRVGVGGPVVPDQAVADVGVGPIDRCWVVVAVIGDFADVPACGGCCRSRRGCANIYRACAGIVIDQFVFQVDGPDAFVEDAHGFSSPVMIFLRGIPFDPPLAGITAKIFITFLLS